MTKTNKSRMNKLARITCLIHVHKTSNPQNALIPTSDDNYEEIVRKIPTIKSNQLAITPERFDGVKPPA